jgi:hypothetical protein
LRPALRQQRRFEYSFEVSFFESKTENRKQFPVKETALYLAKSQTRELVGAALANRRRA